MDLNPAPTETDLEDESPEPTARMPRPDRQTWWATLFLLCAILGAMLGLSVRTQQAVRHIAEATGANISQKQVEDQQRTITALQNRINKYEAGVTSHTAETRALSDDLKSAKFLAGLTAAKGPGVVVTLNDSKKPLLIPGGLGPGIAPPNIIHDTDINAILNELKQAGAEALSVNDQRLVAVSAVRCAGPTVFVNNTQAAPPFVIRAIGDPKTLQPALNIPGGIADQVSHFDPAMMKIETVKRVVVPAYSGVLQPKYAAPVSAATAEADKKPGA